MATVVNDPKNLPVIIASTGISNLENCGIPEDFIKSLVAPRNNKVGKETDAYYMIGVHVPISTNRREYFDALYQLSEFLDYCSRRGFTFIMLKKDK